MHAIVHGADVQDRDGGALVMATLFGLYPFLLKLYADGGYQGAQFQRALKTTSAGSISKSSNDPIKPKASSSCPSAGSSSGLSPGWAAAAGSPRIGSASIARRSLSSNSPPSASCCESFAILYNLPGQTLRNSMTRA